MQPSDAEPAARPRGRLRWWPPIAILVGGAATVAVLQLIDFPTAANQFLASASATALTLVLLFAWCVLGTGLRWSQRGLLIAGAILLLATLRLTVRVVGVSGDIVPRLAWRWSPKPDERLVDKPATEATPAVDILVKGEHDFPQFLGTDRRGVVSGVRLARDWSAQPPKMLWRQPIGAGWSSFAVVGRSAVTQEQRGDQELTVCYDVQSGEPQWSHAQPGRFSSVVAGDGPRATPTIADGRVYVLSANGALECLDGATGHPSWSESHDILRESLAENLQWGMSQSPLIVDNLVVVGAGGRDGHSLLAFDRLSGKPVWTAGNDPISYASPTLTTLAGLRQIVMVNFQSVVGHDPATGRVLWRFGWQGDQPKVPQPVPLPPDRLLISAGYGIGSQMLALQSSGKDKQSVESVWESRALKPKFSNLVVRDGFAYGLDDGKALVCLDLADGHRVWRGGRYGHGQVLLVDDLILVLAESGEVALVAANNEGFKELTRFQAIEGKTWNTPALSGQRLLVRNAEEAACYELPLAPNPN